MSAMPHSLQPLETYFTRANELNGAHPFVAHHLRLFGFELAMKMKGNDAGSFLLAEMEKLEVEKRTVKAPLYQPAAYPDPNWKPPPPPELEPVPAAAEAPDIDAAASDATDAAPAAAPAADGAGAESVGFVGNILNPFPKQPPKPPPRGEDTAKEDVAKEGVKEGVEKMTLGEGGSSSAAAGKPAAPPKPPMITPPKTTATPQQALRMLAFDLYERARHSDKPDVYPSPSTTWGVTEAPKIARCLHAAAVILDAMKQFDPKLPADVERIQIAAHRRSVKLGGQINHSFKFKDGEPIPLKWRPADMTAVTPLPPNEAPPPPPPVAPALFPSVPGGR
mmetsp:Transcript_23508/g.60074  ORF Transcript_23508/g.60074 Transcript_23508/m.60074 type:complete len:335 (+) Transcript_23508:66-1070(+)